MIWFLQAKYCHNVDVLILFSTFNLHVLHHTYSVVFPCLFVFYCCSPTFTCKGAIEKSARAAGLPIGLAIKYAADLARRYPGNTCVKGHHLGAAPLT